MVSSKNSPNRRKSIAGTTQNKPTIPSRSKRRPHSIVPGDRLSPFAKRRRSLAPRKSILKIPTPFLIDDTNGSQSQPQQSLSLAEDESATQTDITLVLNNEGPKMPRKSLARRVSFAAMARVVTFEKSDKDRKNRGDTPSNSDPSSSPSQAGPSQPTVPTDENAYPEAASHQRRRKSSIRVSSEGSDMDLTSVGDFDYQGNISDLANEDFDFDEGDSMEVTEVIPGNLQRNRSLSVGGSRQPLAPVEQSIDDTASDEVDQSLSYTDGESLSDVDGTQFMEYTIPLNQPLRPPAHQDEAWLALCNVTGSVDAPAASALASGGDASGNMDLDDAVERLMRARESLAFGPTPNEDHGSLLDDTFSSTEGSFADDLENGDRTLNISKVLGRPSLANPDSRFSLGQGSNMDESEVYGSILPAPPAPAVSQPTPEETTSVPLSTSTRSTVFQPPTSSITQSTTSTRPSQLPRKVTIPVPFSFTTRASTSASSPSKSAAPPSPSKAKARPSFTAAFAPPSTRPSPRKSIAPQPPSIPQKRPRSVTSAVSDAENADVDKPSPPKKAALSDKASIGGDLETPAQPARTLPLSPSKQPSISTSTTITTAPTSRRQSGYYARRKSLGIGLKKPDEVVVASVASPRKTGAGRASLSSGASDAWKRFNKDVHLAKPAVAQSLEKVGPSTTEQGSEPSPRRTKPVLLVDEVVHDHAVGDDSQMELDSPEENRLEHVTDHDATEQWRDGVEAHDYGDEETAPISIQQFFSMTGIKFMDELTAPRRSTHPSQSPVRHPRKPEDIPHAEFVTAMSIDIPQLVLYSRVSKDLQAWMDQSKIVFAQAEDEASKITPELFTEYSRADEDGQAELLHQLKLIRTNTRGLAKSDWYDWKLQWVEGLRVTADQAYASLQADAKILNELKAAADGVVPALQQEYDEIMKELEQEQAEVAELEGCDQDYLNELKASIAEQNVEVEALQAELAESNTQLQWLQERLQELNAQKQEASTVIAESKRLLHVQKNGTRAEVFRLKDELEALEDLHLFHAVKVSPDLFEYIYASLYRVAIPCHRFVPLTQKVEITRVDKTRSRSKDDFPHLTNFLNDAAKQLVIESGAQSVRQIIHTLRDYWTACAQLLAQIRLLTVKFPVEIQVLRGGSPRSATATKGEAFCGFKARTMVLFPSVQAKAFISFVFPIDTFARWPMSVDALDCEVEIAYGKLERGAIIKAVIDRLGEATPSENYACLLDACIEAQELYH